MLPAPVRRIELKTGMTSLARNSSCRYSGPYESSDFDEMNNHRPGETDLKRLRSKRKGLR
jgi:hypothetical protein